MAITQMVLASIGLPRPQTHATGRRCPLGQYPTASVSGRRAATKGTPIHIVYFPVSPALALALALAPLPPSSRGVEM